LPSEVLLYQGDDLVSVTRLKEVNSRTERPVENKPVERENGPRVGEPVKPGRNTGVCLAGHLERVLSSQLVNISDCIIYRLRRLRRSLTALASLPELCLLPALPVSWQYWEEKSTTFTPLNLTALIPFQARWVMLNIAC